MTPERAKVLLVNPTHAEGLALLERSCDVTCIRDTRPDVLRPALADADIAIVRLRLPDDAFDHAPRLLGAIRHGAGVDLIPVEQATRHGIVVANVPGVNSNTVAEYCVAQMLNLSRRLVRIDSTLRSKGWDVARPMGEQARDLAGKTAGIVGVGNIGGRLAEILHAAFRMSVLGHQRHLDALPSYVRGCTLAELFAESDFIVLSCPLTNETRGLVSRELLAGAKAGACIVNVSRGAVIDDAALIEALRAGRLGGAALDVFVEQPLPANHPFYSLENVLLTPHLAGGSMDSTRAISIRAAEQALQILAGEKPRHFYNPEVWEQARARRR